MYYTICWSGANPDIVKEELGINGSPEGWNRFSTREDVINFTNTLVRELGVSPEDIIIFPPKADGLTIPYSEMVENYPFEYEDKRAFEAFCDYFGFELISDDANPYEFDSYYADVTKEEFFEQFGTCFEDLIDKDNHNYILGYITKDKKDVDENDIYDDIYCDQNEAWRCSVARVIDSALWTH